MAEKKASSRAPKKASTAKKSTGRSRSASARSGKGSDAPVIINEGGIVEIVQTTGDDSAVKTSVRQKAVALRPSALLAELFGTFVLAGVVIRLAGGGTLGQLGIALTLAILVVVFGVISGAHLNPAITIAQYVNRKIDGIKAVAYLVAQILGALLAFVVLHSLWQAGLEQAVTTALTNQGVTADQISAGGGLLEFLKANGVESLADAAKLFQIEFISVTVAKGSEWITVLSELIGAIVFGLGIGYAALARKKSQLEAGLAVGVGLLAGLTVGGAAVILNPAVAIALQAFGDWNVFAGASVAAFWWSAFAYIGATTIGITLGFTLYRLILNNANKEVATE